MHSMRLSCASHIGAPKRKRESPAEGNRYLDHSLSQQYLADALPVILLWGQSAFETCRACACLWKLQVWYFS